MFPWLQQTFVGEEDCVTSPKNVCVGGYVCWSQGNFWHSLPIARGGGRLRDEPKERLRRRLCLLKPREHSLPIARGGGRLRDEYRERPSTAYWLAISYRMVLENDWYPWLLGLSRTDRRSLAVTWERPRKRKQNGGKIGLWEHSADHRFLQSKMIVCAKFSDFLNFLLLDYTLSCFASVKTVFWLPVPPRATRQVGCYQNGYFRCKQVSHHKQYPSGTTIVFSYFESRGGKFPEVCFFGLQYLIKVWSRKWELSLSLWAGW